MVDHGERARALFLEGYNCAQAVVCAFSDVTGLDVETSARYASSFGGGLRRGLLRQRRDAGQQHRHGEQDRKRSVHQSYLPWFAFYNASV